MFDTTPLSQGPAVQLRLACDQATLLDNIIFIFFDMGKCGSEKRMTSYRHRVTNRVKKRT